MRFYIAARFDRCAEMNGYAEELRQEGHTVECRWLQGLHQLHPGAEQVDTGHGIPLLAAPFAKDDVEDLVASDALIFFSEPPESHSKRGGRHVEFGMALALGKKIWVIGQRENVFHCLPEVHRFDSWEDFMNYEIMGFEVVKP